MKNLLSLDLLNDCRRLFLRDFKIDARIGIHDFELAKPQRLIINIDLYVPLRQTSSARDDIDDIVDYDFVRYTVMQRISKGHINLQETLCDDVLSSILSHPSVYAARVSSYKPDVYPDCAGVGVEVFGRK